jgi:hypothetical protein
MTAHIARSGNHYAKAVASRAAASTGVERRATPSSGQPVIFRDRTGRTSLVLYTKGPLRGRLALQITHHHVFTAKLPRRVLGHRSITLNTTVLAEALGSTASRKIRLVLNGTLQPPTHYAHLTIILGRGIIRTSLVTASVNPAAAKKASSRAIALLASNNLKGLAGMLAQPGTNPATIAHELEAQGVHLDRIHQPGRGHTIWLADGNPGWLQPITATIVGHPTMHVNLILEQEDGHWRLLGTTR